MSDFPDRFEEVETRQAFQEDLLQKLDDALEYQTRLVLDLERQVSRLLERIESLEQSIDDIQPQQDDGPPPHY